MTNVPAIDPHDPGADAAAARAGQYGDAAAVPITLAGGGTVRIGTASWTDPTMTAQGVFYPPDAHTAEDRLTYYAQQFPVVEVDATYYAPPVARTAALWAKRTPPDFVFDAKTHALMTGQPTETRRLPRALREALPAELAAKPRLYGKELPEELWAGVWKLFLEGLEPLRSAGQLGSILLQYPRWFFPSSESRDAIVEAQGRLEGLACAVEFRNGTWLNEKNAERTLAFLADHALPLVMVDEPQGFRSSVPPTVAVTSSELAIVRFHGRRADTWEARGVTPSERFRYLYDRGELRAWVPRIRQAAAAARDVHVLMNNCFANYGTTNARELAALLADVRLGDD